MAKDNRSTGKNSQESQDEQVNDIAGQAVDFLLVIQDFGENLHRIPLTGWTVGRSLRAHVGATRTCVAALPSSKDVRVIRLLKDASGLLDAIERAAEAFEHPDFDNRLSKHPETQASGIGIKRLAEEALGTIERASYLMAPSTFSGFSLTAQEIEKEFPIAKAA